MEGLDLQFLIWYRDISVFDQEKPFLVSEAIAAGLLILAHDAFWS